MQKERNLFLINISVLQIVLLICASFSFAFIFSEYAGVGSAIVPLSGESGTIAGGASTSTVLKETPKTGSDGIFGSIGDFVGKAYGGKLWGVGPAVEGGTAFAGAASSLTSGALWGITVYFAVKLIGSLFGLDEGLTNALASSLGLGVGVGSTLYYIGQNFQQISYLTTPTASFVIGLGVAVAVFIATYKKEKQEVINFECLPWQPPLGGDSCDECNKDPSLPCSEYRCKSLGQACELVNQGTEEELCVWVNKGDTQAPKINPWPEAFKPQGLRFIPDTAISPPNKGFKIIDENDRKGCLEAFTKLEFGITTTEDGNKPEASQCRIDYDLTETYDEMLFLFGENNLFRFNHTQKLKVPDPLNPEAVPELYNDGTFTLYTRCVDANGNGKDSAAVAFSFCVKDGPDTTPPTIEGTSINSGSFVRFDADKVPIEVYVNEPANCKWSRQDKDYSEMENTMSCANQVHEINANLDYVCTTELTGIKNDQDNNFYFRCEDLSRAGKNKMATSFPLLLKGSGDPLIIKSVGPNGTIEGGESVVGVELRVETAFGAENGKAVCLYALGEERYIEMDNTDSYLHNQSQFLEAGNYEYFFQCIDSGGNTARDSTTFTVRVDNAEPKITRVFKDGNNLKIITNEDAECVYSTTNCDYNFEDGIALSYESSSSELTRDMHYVSWNPIETYYVKCQDLNGRRPSANRCSVIAQGSEF